MANKFAVGYSSDSEYGRIEPTSAQTLKTAIAAAKRAARRFQPHWDYKGFGPYWSVYDADTGEELQRGRL